MKEEIDPKFMYITKVFEQPELNKLLDDHELFLKDKTQGKCLKLEGYSFDSGDLDGRDLSFADFINCSFVGARMANIYAIGSSFKGSNFSYASIVESKFDLCDFDNCNFDNADTYMTKMIHCTTIGTEVILTDAKSELSLHS